MRFCRYVKMHLDSFVAVYVERLEGRARSSQVHRLRTVETRDSRSFELLLLLLLLPS